MCHTVYVSSGKSFKGQRRVKTQLSKKLPILEVKMFPEDLNSL